MEQDTQLPKGIRIIEIVETMWGPMGLGEEAFNEVADYLEFGIGSDPRD